MNKYGTKYETGFTNSELVELCKILECNYTELSTKLFGNTCMMSDSGETINYHHDIFRASRQIIDDQIRSGKRVITVKIGQLYFTSSMLTEEYLRSFELYQTRESKINIIIDETKST